MELRLTDADFADFTEIQDLICCDLIISLS